MKKYTIHLSYATRDEEEFKVDTLQRKCILLFKETFPDAQLQSVFVAKEVFEPAPAPTDVKKEG